MIISFAGYTFQIATLYFAIISSDNIAWPIAIVGSIVSGTTHSSVFYIAIIICVSVFKRTDVSNLVDCPRSVL
jgi:hypothetical protein